MDWLNNQGAYNLWLIADADAGFSLSEPFAARERLSVTARADRWWRAYLQTIIRLKAQQYAQFRTSPRALHFHCGQHLCPNTPLSVQPEAELHYSLTLDLPTVESGPAKQFLWCPVLRRPYLRHRNAQYRRPQRWLRLYTDIEQRRPDSHRLAPQQK